MTETHLIGIDMELRELRVTAYDQRGEKILGSRAKFDPNSIDDWARAFRDATVYLPNARNIISAVGTSGTIIPVDEYGRQVFPPQWYFETAPEQAARINELGITETLVEKGLSVSASSPIAKILALREHNPESFADVEWLLSPTTWILYRLHNGHDRRWTEVETDWNNALKFGADITGQTPRWFTPLFEELDVPLDLFPEITSPGAPIGLAESELAADTGLADAELYHGLTDGNASAMAAGALQTGDCSIICGSSSVIKYVSSDIDTHRALYYHRHPIEGYLASAAFDTGVVLQWFCENVLDLSVEEGLRLAQSTTPGDEPRVYLQADRSPFFNPDMGTTMLDLWPTEEESVEETRGRLVRGIATSIALSERTYFPLLESHFSNSIDRINLVSGGDAYGQGPFTWWNALRASIWDYEVEKMEPRTTVGALIPPALEVSLYDDIDEASEMLLRSNGTVTPDDGVRDAYADRRHEFKNEWESIQGIYELFDR